MEPRPNQRFRSRLRAAAIPCGLFCLALLIRVAYAGAWKFDGLYGQDAYAYFNQARAMYQAIPRGSLPPRDFFWPNGFPVLVAMSMLVGGMTPFAAQAVSMITGSLLAPLIYALGLECFDRTAAIMAGLMVATASQLILSSIVIMSDTTALFWAVFGVWLAVRACQSSTPVRWMIGVGIALSLAMVTRWIYGLLVPVVGVYGLASFRRRNQPWWYLLVPVGSGAPLIVAQIGLSLGRPEGMVHSWLLGWNPVNGLLRSFSTVEGHLTYALPNGLFYAQPLFHPSYLLPPLGLLAVWGGWRCFNQTWERHWIGVLLCGWIGLAYAFLAGIPNQNFRLGMTLFPPLVLLAGFGWTQITILKRRGWVNGGIAACIVLGSLGWSYSPINRFLERQTYDKTVAQKVAAVVPTDTPVIAFGLTLTLMHYTDLQVFEFYTIDQSQVERLLQCEGQVYLVMNPAIVETQWQGSQMEATYRWLQAHTQMETMDEWSPYTLQQINRSANELEQRSCELR